MVGGGGGWMEGWVGGWMDRRTDRQIDRYMIFVVELFSVS